jgi:hypothetical protein
MNCSFQSPDPQDGVPGLSNYGLRFVLGKVVYEEVEEDHKSRMNLYKGENLSCFTVERSP